ncbi:MAG: class I SAM-dependent methyltransferase [Candidatus Accumulibacter sp.]|uniref:class I SAM-dependent methyltransferase n=1 Tax=Accumulibacter sp. TaxID=2053492 RepID=UPI00258E4D1C|nr:class I SAM-dependent methyltransferase [Accumulibacter sp.]MCM8621348.1 class I SAM-dependent methyltransferase [Accumulibacter sp.]
MNIIPWRLRSAISDRFPLIYHFAANLFRKHAGEAYWDQNLADSWGCNDRRWPTKIDIIAQRTSRQSSVIDVACGNGSMLRGLRNCGFTDLAGLEISRYAVDRLREEGFSMFHGKLPSIPIADSQFDAVIASQVLEHIIQRHRFASEIGRILKPEGQAFFFVPNDCLGPIDEPEHVIKYNHTSFEAFLKRHFEVISIEVIKDANYPMSILLGHIRKRPRQDRNL